MLLNKRFDIGTVICPRAVVLARGRRPRANTTAREQITVPISNLLFNDNFITYITIIYCKDLTLKEYFI